MSRLYLRSTLKSFVHTPHTQSICNKTAICCLLPDGLFRMPSVFFADRHKLNRADIRLNRPFRKQ